MKYEKIFGPILLDKKQAASIHRVLLATGNTELALLIESKAKLSGKECQFAIAARRALNGELDVDEEPVISQSEDGAFVMAWHWVNSSEILE